MAYKSNVNIFVRYLGAVLSSLRYILVAILNIDYTCMLHAYVMQHHASFSQNEGVSTLLLN